MHNKQPTFWEQLTLVYLVSILIGIAMVFALGGCSSSPERPESDLPVSVSCTETLACIEQRCGEDVSCDVCDHLPAAELAWQAHVSCVLDRGSCDYLLDQCEGEG